MTTQDRNVTRANLLVTRTLELVLKLMYRYRIEGRENVPDEGPFIVLYNEPSFLCQLLEMVTNEAVLKRQISEDKVLYFIGEEMWSIGFFRKNFETVTPARPSLPTGAGLLGASLLEVLRHLEDGGVWVSNPDGDVARDGRPMPMRGGAPWVGLHSAAPIVAIAPAINAYDTWPPWSMRPSLRGRLIARVGKPFRLTDSPLDRFTDEELTRAKARIAEEMERLAYGPGGVAGWTGQPTMNGQPLGAPVDLRSAVEQVGIASTQHVGTTDEVKGGIRSLWGRKLALLLWRCPICLTDDALVHEQRWFRPDRLCCQACGTQWVVRRVQGRDFRLEVVEGPSNLVGLEMALTTWYDAMKRDFQPSPIPASGVDLVPGEELYLRTGEVRLIGYPSNTLLQGWAGREPPQDAILRRSEAGQFQDLGTGRLLLTNRRLVWEGPQGGLDFWLEHITDVNLRLFFMGRLNYGLTPYRFVFTQDSGLKWLTYVVTAAEQITGRDGRKLTMSPF
ncbi:MAG: lysophospholipid acyltransferase family protein [Anaerolineae bacterium]|jgi:1-acyl-sn-glycerol-3-phosphate acyltransferase